MNGDDRRVNAHNAPDRLAIIVGVTGHRDLRPEDEPALTTAVRGIFERFRAAYPETPLVVLTPLAVGADRLVARVALELDIPFRVPLPMPEAEYRRDFSPDEAREFDDLLAHAHVRFELPYVAGNTPENVDEPRRRAQQYRLVGTHIARASHVLIALWDGRSAATIGGTSDIVNFRLQGEPDPFGPPAALLDSPEAAPVYHVMTPRRSDDDPPAAAGLVTLLTRTGTIDLADDPYVPLYKRIDKFNLDKRRFDAPTGHEGSPLFKLKATAETIATVFQRRYVRSLRLIFITSAIAAIMLTLAHADHPQYWYVMVYAILAAVGFVPFILAKRNGWQDRFIEYRALELGLTVQSVWDRAGVDAAVADVYLRLQRSELDWIREAIRTVHYLDTDLSKDAQTQIASVREFVADQRGYFERVSHRDEKLDERFELGTQCFFWVGIAISVFLTGLAVWHLAAGERAIDPIEELGDRCIKALAISTILAAVLHEYPKSRAFHAQSRRYATMFSLYDRALAILDTSANAPLDEQLQRAREVAWEIGREALAENGDWVMMHRELPVEALHI